MLHFLEFLHGDEDVVDAVVLGFSVGFIGTGGIRVCNLVGKINVVDGLCVGPTVCDLLLRIVDVVVDLSGDFNGGDGILGGITAGDVVEKVVVVDGL